MIRKPVLSSHQRLLSEFLAYILLKRAHRFRQTCPQMAVFAHDFIGIEINVYGRYENRELEVLSTMIADMDRSKVVLDVGANIGNHTMFFVKEGFEQIHAFEPNPRTSKLLDFNTERHPQVTAHPYGLSTQDATLEAAIPLTNVGGASLQIAGTGAEVVSFKVRKFDDLPLAEQPVVLLKLDVEGHEAEVIEGMYAMLERDAPLILFECNRKTERKAADRLISVLKTAGYDTFSSIERSGFTIPASLPAMMRRPLRMLEMLVSPKLTRFEVKPVQQFDVRNYPMVVASCSVSNQSTLRSS